MVIVSYSAYFIDVTDHYTQITIALTTILTVIAFSFSVESSMPKVPYLTYIDCFFLATYMIVFLALLVLIVIHTMVKRNNHRRDIEPPKNLTLDLPHSLLPRKRGHPREFLRLTIVRRQLLILAPPTL